MGLLLNLLGFFLATGAAATVAETARNWRGSLREGLFLFLGGFLLFGIGFLWNIFSSLKILPDIELVFFASGAAFMLWGAKRVFAFTSGTPV